MDVEAIHGPLDKAGRIGMGDHHAFGLSGRPGGVEDVGQVIRQIGHIALRRQEQNNLLSSNGQVYS